MISASRAIMSIAAAAKLSRDQSSRTVQKQTVNINLANHGQANPRSKVQTAYVAQTPTQTYTPVYPEITERSIELEPEEPAAEPYKETTTASIPAAHRADPTFGGEPYKETAVNSDVYAQLQDLHSMLNNYETVAQALILIIDLIQSNPLMINKLIVPTEDSFRELLMVLTGAEDVDFKYLDDVGCTLSSKKYRLVEEIFITKDTEPKSLKYAYPEVARLFDRFKISTKMVACKV